MIGITISWIVDIVAAAIDMEECFGVFVMQDRDGWRYRAGLTQQRLMRLEYIGNFPTNCQSFGWLAIQSKQAPFAGFIAFSALVVAPKDNRFGAAAKASRAIVVTRQASGCCQFQHYDGWAAMQFADPKRPSGSGLVARVMSLKQAID